MMAAGLAPIAAGMLLLLRLPLSGSYAANLLPTMLLMGGFGVAFPAMITLAMSAAVDPSVAGVTSGLVNTTQQVGAALGVAVLSTLAPSRAAAVAPSGAPYRAARASAGRAGVADVTGGSGVPRLVCRCAVK